jgi:periplasmic protein TonB
VIGSLQKEVTAEAIEQLSTERKQLLELDSSLNDIVFENRNKTYGAYKLRRDYQGNVQRATLIGVGIFLLIFGLPELYARLVQAPDRDDIGFEVEFNPINIKPPVTPIDMLPSDETPEEPVSKVRILPPGMQPDERAMEEYQAPPAEVTENSQSGKELVGNRNGTRIVISSADRSGYGWENLVEVKPEAEKELLVAQQQPEFVGGQWAFSDFLRKNLKYPPEAAQVGVQGKVYLEFSVGPEGRIENARVIKGIGFGCDEEALRVVNLMPNWLPGRQSGHAIRVKYILPVSFQLD